MKTLITAVTLALLVGCTAEEKNVDSQGRVFQDRREVCMNGVVYYISSVHGGNVFAPKFKPDSTVETCN